MGLALAIWRSTFVVILRVLLASMHTWLWKTSSPGVEYNPVNIEDPDDEKNGPGGYKNFIIVEFNAWECAESDVLWASLITKIFDKASSKPCA